jgi:DNA-binding NtrC family response regulator
LAQLVKANRFREDLRFRINTVTLEIPALRERPEDVPALAATLLETLAGPATPSATVAPDALQLLQAYHWPGNIRELKNVLERALLFCKDGVIDRRALRFDRSLEPDEETGVRTLDEAERHHITTTLQRLGGRVDDAAKVLDVSRSALYAKLKKYGIRAPAVA